MAASTVVARRYAEALFAAALAADRVESVQRDLAMLRELVRSTPPLLAAMSNPLIPAERKESILEQLFAHRIEPVSLRFLHLLVRKQRIGILPLVHDLYVEMANEHRGVLPALVSTAMPLADEEEQALADRLTAMTGKQVVLHIEVQPSLIGGLRVRVGDTVLDGTVVGYLRQLRERLRATLA